MSTTNLMVKSKLPPQSGFHSSTEAVKPHPEKSHKVFLYKQEHLTIRIIDLRLGK